MPDRTHPVRAIDATLVVAAIVFVLGVLLAEAGEWHPATRARPGGIGAKGTSSIARVEAPEADRREVVERPETVPNRVEAPPDFVPVDAPRSVRGAIVDAEGRTLPGAEVRLESIASGGKRVLATAFAGGDGRFDVELPEWEPDDARSGTLEIAAPGHARLWIDAVRVPVVGFVDVGCLRVLRPAPVFGRVVDSDGRGVAGAAIALSPDRSDAKGTVHDFATAEATTGADGAFEIRDLGVGSYFLRATASGFERRGAHLRVLSERESSRVEITLSPRAPLVLEVVDSGGRPVEGALVRVAHASLVSDHPRDRFLRWLGGRSTTDAEGRAVRTDVAPGDWISVGKVGLRADPLTIEEEDFAEHAPRRVVLERVGELKLLLGSRAMEPPVDEPERIDLRVLGPDREPRRVSVGPDRVEVIEPNIWIVRGLEGEPVGVRAHASGRSTRGWLDVRRILRLHLPWAEEPRTAEAKEARKLLLEFVDSRSEASWCTDGLRPEWAPEAEVQARFHWPDGIPISGSVVRTTPGGRWGWAWGIDAPEDPMAVPFPERALDASARELWGATERDGTIRIPGGTEDLAALEVHAAGPEGESLAADLRRNSAGAFGEDGRIVVPLFGAIEGSVAWHEPWVAEPLLVVASPRSGERSEERTTLSAVDGTFVLRGLVPGIFDVAAVRTRELASCVRTLRPPLVSEYRPRIGQRAVEVAPGEVAHVEIAADEPARRASLRARFVSESGFPIEGLRVFLRLTDARGNSEDLALPFDPRGADLALSALVPGTYRVEVWDPEGLHAAAVRDAIPVRSGEACDLGDVVLREATGLRLRPPSDPVLAEGLSVVDARGDAVPEQRATPGSDARTFAIAGPATVRLVLYDARRAIEALDVVAELGSGFLGRFPARRVLPKDRGTDAAWIVEIPIPAEPTRISIDLDACLRVRTR